ncbi:DUF1616 domain-containing protein [Candidatus Chloroploca sp. Khr17]|uniref:DUF1616 domain-containing protein n=1 Tax=Candidatus Chloroploca sp. Khr17 TaxID=2496869 RepID=UPI001F109B6A|nr:DUF1616 domain-containing protein [Candidatus Chloroploca sp. Khr17]
MKLDQPLEQPILSSPRITALDRGYDLLLLGIFALAIPLLLLMPAWLWPLRVPMGLVAVLLAPGYALQAALFSGRADLDGIARIGLSSGLSVALISLLALLLDRLPWGIRPWPIAISLAATILLFAGVALVRRRRLGADAFVPPAPRPRAWWHELPPRLRLGYAALALTLIGLGTATYVTLTLPDPAEHLTEFYILGAAGMAEDYPRAGAVGEELWVTMGITNREAAPRSYRVEVWAVDPWEADRRELLGEAGPFELADGATHEQRLTWAMPWAGDDQTVEFYLFTGDEAEEVEPYRQLRLWLNGTEQ